VFARLCEDVERALEVVEALGDQFAVTDLIPGKGRW